ncbi:PAS domain S-box protein [Gramella sp. KN1008]|uniref:PAS domain S-box protein n=1 Tax=Gramella sp. KN1008 TaxID=2529298 RepID=UPI00103BDBBE|nr:PAS domain S-box protein [Gramella sp. KN1008]TBW25780.1 PAS domain S-box protein [Gramella sp. KN1008]
MNEVEERKFSILCENLNLFEFTQQYGLDGIVIFNLHAPHSSWINPKLRSVLGYDNRPSPELKFSDLLTSSNLAELSSYLNTEFPTDIENPFEGTVQLRNTSDNFLTFNYRIVLLKGTNPEVIMALELAKDSNVSIHNLNKELTRYKNILKGTNLATWQWNVQTGETIFSEEWANVLGYRLEDLAPTSESTWSTLSHPDDQKVCDNLIKAHFRGESEFYVSEARMKHRSGKWIWVKDQGQVVTWTIDGKPEWMTGFHEEVTEYKERLALKKLFIDEAPSAIAMLDNEMRYIAASNKWIEDYNLQGREVLGKSHYDIFPNLSDDWKEIHRDCLRGNTHKREEDSFVREDGATHWLSWEVKPWYKGEGEIGGILMHTANITPIKEAEKEIFEKKQLMQTVLNSINVGIVACDAHGKLNLFNKATRHWHGIPKRDIPEKDLSNYYGLFHAKDDRELKAKDIPLLKALRGKKVENEEIRIIPKENKERIVSVNGSQLLDEYGHVTGAVVAMHDITERIEAENRIRISEETFRGSFEHAAIGMATVNPDGRWIKVNQRVCEIVGYEREELLNLTFQDITHPDDLDADLKLLEKLVEGERDYYHMDKRYFHKEGHIVYIHLAVSLVRDKYEEPLYFIAQIQDISRRKMAEKKLSQTLAKLESLLEASTQVSIIAVNKEGIITTFNKGAENLLGYSKDEVIGKETPSFIHLEEEMERISKKISPSNELLKGMAIFAKLAEINEYDTREWTYVRKDGISFPVQLTVTSIKEDKETIGYLGVATDISGLKKAEKEIKTILKLTEDQNDRLKNFAHIVSHNLRSHSSNFGMLLELYIQDHPEQAENQIIQMLTKASGNLKETIEHLNEVTAINTSENEQYTCLNLKSAVETVLSSVSGIIEEAKIRILNEIPPHMDVNGVSAYLESILLNFTTNAIKYRGREKSSYIRYFAEVSGDYIKLSIEDNGLGIDLKKHGEKLFGMYKTFHRHPDSRGIGLFITKNQIEALGGKVAVKSEVNSGTTFEIYLKRYEKN